MVRIESLFLFGWLYRVNLSRSRDIESDGDFSSRFPTCDMKGIKLAAVRDAALKYLLQEHVGTGIKITASQN